MPFFNASGVRCMLAGTVFFAVGSMLVKLAGQGLPPLQVLFARAVVGIVYSVALIRGTGAPILGNRKGLLLLRGVLGFAAMGCNFYSFIHLPLADATVLLFLHPVFVALLAVPVLGERMTARGVLSVLVSLSGIVLVTQPSFLFGTPMPLPPLAVSVAILGALLSSFAIISVRRLAQHEHPLSVIIYPPMVILFGAPLLDGWNWDLPDGTQWLLLAGVGLFTNMGQHLMTQGYQKDKAGPVSAIGYLEIVMAALLGWAVFGAIPGPMTLAGSLLIIGGSVALARSEAKPIPTIRPGKLPPPK